MHPYRPRINGNVLGVSDSLIRADLHILGRYKTLFPKSSKMTYIIEDIKKFWFYHLTNVALFIFFSSIGVLLAMGFNCAMKRVEEQSILQILIKLPPKALAEVSYEI